MKSYEIFEQLRSKSICPVVGSSASEVRLLSHVVVSAESIITVGLFLFVYLFFMFTPAVDTVL